MILAEDIEQAGFTIARQAVDARTLESVEAAIVSVLDPSNGVERKGSFFGMRNLLAEVPEARALASGNCLRRIVSPVLGKPAAAVRGIYFDKTRAANWSLGWHQDRAIAVRERVCVKGFESWSVKAGVHHVLPPAEILMSMLTVRIHLDACDSSTGALVVLPGSHRQIIEDRNLQEIAATQETVSCDVARGDAVVMRPLIGHASARSERPDHRRVIHIEYASAILPEPLKWNEFVPFSAAV